MGKSLKQMRSAQAKKVSSGRPTRTVEMCLAQDLVAEVEKLEDEQNDLEVAAQRAPAAAGQPAPGKAKLSQGANPRIAEIQDRLVELHDAMNDYTGTLTLRGEPWGDWRRWADANPPRVYDPEDKDVDDALVAAVRLDREVALGYCNAHALLDRLQDFAEAWDDAPIDDDDWAELLERAPGGDLKEAARKVVQMHESGGMRAPKSQKPSPATSGPSTD